jgi:hypothetical protein
MEPFVTSIRKLHHWTCVVRAGRVQPPRRRRAEQRDECESRPHGGQGLEVRPWDIYTVVAETEIGLNLPVLAPGNRGRTAGCEKDLLGLIISCGRIP